MAYSAIELYQLFYAILRTFVNSIEYHFEFYRILAAGEFGVEPIDVIVFNVQAVMSLDESRYSLQPRMLEILEWVHQDPKYYSFMLRVAESTPLMSRVQQDCLTNMTDFERFVQSLQLDNPEATHANIVNSLNEFMETLRNGKYLVLRRILEDEWRTALAAVSDWFLMVVYALMKNDELYEEFCSILQIPLIQIKTIAYDFFRSRLPEAWEPFCGILDQELVRMAEKKAEEEEGYESYEDFITKNFIETGALEMLEEATNQAEMEHMFSNMNL